MSGHPDISGISASIGGSEGVFPCCGRMVSAPTSKDDTQAFDEGSLDGSIIVGVKSLAPPFSCVLLW